jgi:hypothetical protein
MASRSTVFGLGIGERATHKVRVADLVSYDTTPITRQKKTPAFNKGVSLNGLESAHHGMMPCSANEYDWVALTMM